MSVQIRKLKTNSLNTHVHFLLYTHHQAIQIMKLILSVAVLPVTVTPAFAKIPSTVYCFR